MTDSPQEMRSYYRQPRPIDPVESAEWAERAFKRYLAYVLKHTRYVPQRPAVLDAGCGVGWSSLVMARAGFARAVVGVDLSLTFVETTQNLSFISGDVSRLPFGPASFDIVACYQFLEHVPQPGHVLDEMIRVLRPRGIIVVAGPNLLSPLAVLQYLPRFLFATPIAHWFVRNPKALRSPLGNTLPEKIAVFFADLALLVRKMSAPRVDFLLRSPDLRGPGHADTDACYLLNPLDVRKYLSQRGLRIIGYQNGGRLRLGRLGALSGGTWVVGRKQLVTG